MLSNRLHSVKDTYFQHKVLTKITGKPTFATLQTLHIELKANAGSVPSTLGGGSLGHLGLLLPPAAYATLQPPSIPWVTPVHPGPLAPPATATPDELASARAVWQESFDQFQICQSTEKALIAQTVEAVDSIYLRALLNRNTGQYTTSITSLMNHLFMTYGKLTPQQVKAKETEVGNMTFNISQPVDIIFNAIEDLSSLAFHANSPMSSQQMIDIAFIIFAKQPVLQQDLRAWKHLAPKARTWAAMIIHFREAQDELSAMPVASDLYHNTPPHQANHVEAIADLVAQRLLDTVTPFLEPPPPSMVPAHVPMPPVVQSRDEADNALIAQIHAVIAEINASTNAAALLVAPPRSNPAPPIRSMPNGRNNHRGRGGGRTPGRGQTTGPRMYCWTHGACAHSSTDCNTPTAGHQPTATFINMQGGSTTRCFWLPG